MKLVLCILIGLQAPDPKPADRRGEAITVEPAYQGTRANAPIPPSMHQQNDPRGFCVVASNVAALRWMGWTEPAARLWAEADRENRRTGYSPDTFERLVRKVSGLPPFLNYEGGDYSQLIEWNRKGHPLGVTMGTGRNYFYAFIAHMVTLCHADNTLACITDNNFVGTYSWMPAPEFTRRWKLGGYAWATCWVDWNRPHIPGLDEMPPLAIVGAAVGLGTLIGLVVAIAMGGRTNAAS